ncbi:MAG: prepilin-type N-terminal cleavage/methylation domain-containing protein [Aquificaceae bacterium]|nr:prepilin-type N-terminal cleavage/methylation domain-containing protein [Aquificaceae bacterium]MCX8060916.1 prepilin-type N-terminal cleavage/methylation domain-containing protein [Aquificaceae bacterium]MDW8097388.1 prepilin-type N-terminal cleavage/methylation domain-containing protein [Aquificaceae bacterium]
MKRGFTLLEVLLVLTLLGIFFGVLSYSFYSSARTSYALMESAELTREEVLLFWNLQRKFVGATDVAVRKEGVFMITSAGDYYQGVVKCAYIYKDGWLYYYEFPYPYGDLTFYEEDRLVKVGRIRELSFRAFVGGQYLEEYRGLPQWVEVNIEGKKLSIGL